MSENTVDSARGLRLAGKLALYILLSGAVMLAAAFGFLYYFTNWFKSGPLRADNAQCPRANALIEKLTPFARGSMAKMNFDYGPRALSDMTFEGPNAEPIKMSDYKGKIVLLNLWANWCEPCQQEMPSLDLLQKMQADSQFQVIALETLVNKSPKSKQFLDQAGVKNLRYFYDNHSAVMKQLRSSQVNGIPATFLVDPDGCAIAVSMGEAEWDSSQALALINAAKSSLK